MKWSSSSSSGVRNVLVSERISAAWQMQRRDRLLCELFLVGGAVRSGFVTVESRPRVSASRVNCDRDTVWPRQMVVGRMDGSPYVQLSSNGQRLEQCIVILILKLAGTKLAVRVGTSECHVKGSSMFGLKLALVLRTDMRIGISLLQREKELQRK